MSSFVEEEVSVEPVGAPKRPRTTTPPRVKCRGGLFLTYPQFSRGDAPPVLEALKLKLLGQLNPYVVRGRIPGGFDKGVIAREKHQDGSYHLHCWLRCSAVDKQIFIDHADLDLEGHHGNYQGAKSDSAVLKYCTKDGDYIWWGQDPKLSAEIKGKHLSSVLCDVIEGRISCNQAVKEKTMLLLHYNKLVSNLAMWKANQVKESLGQPLLLYIYGQAGVGKTSLCRQLSEGRKCYFVSLPLASSSHQTWWFDNYLGEEVMVFDNLSLMTAPPYDLICRLVDRAPCMLPVKGGFLPSRVKMVVMTSVFPLNTLFTGHFDDQMRRRLSKVLKGMWMTPEERASPRMENPLAPRILLEAVTSPPLTSSLRTDPLTDSSTTNLSNLTPRDSINEVWWWDETKLFAPHNAVLGEIPPSTVALGRHLLPEFQAQLQELDPLPSIAVVTEDPEHRSITDTTEQLPGDALLGHGEILAQPVDLFDLRFNDPFGLPESDFSGTEAAPLPANHSDGFAGSPLYYYSD